MLPDKTIVLVGMMGVGKTTVGKQMANMIDREFRDADTEIEIAAGMAVSDYFSLYGEEQFRIGERRVIKRLLDEPAHVLATGGGAFMNETTRKRIKKQAVSVWLQADIETIVERTSRRNTRPLLKTGNPRTILSRLSKERAPVYAEADISIETSNTSHRATAEKILLAIDAFAREK